MQRGPHRETAVGKILERVEDGRKERSLPHGPLGAVPPDLTGAADAEKAILQLDQMAATVPLDKPWTAPNAGTWDGQTFETWKLANTTTSGGQLLLDLGIEAVWAAPNWMTWLATWLW